MRKPDFFIVGAPKCGTSAMHSYLGSHPDVFLCLPKEPNFFATDFPSQRYVSRERDYLRLFEPALSTKVRLGEASAWYLFSKAAIGGIREFRKDAKIIAMVRNPLEMVPSLHGMLLRNFAEDEAELSRAWSLQESRRVGASSVRGRNWRFDPKTSLYSDVCKLGSQLERLYQTFPAHQIHVVVFDDFCRDTKGAYEEVIEFLGVGPDGREEFPAVNVRRNFRSRRVAWLFWRLRDLGAGVKSTVGIVRTFNLLEKLNRWNETPEAPQQVDSALLAAMAAEFREDVDRLGKLLGRDFSHWLNV